MNRAILKAGLLFLFPLLLAGSDLREFTDNQGRSIRASLERVDATTVEIRMENGRMFRVPREKFSKEDQEFFDRYVSVQALKDERSFEIQARRRDENESESQGGGLVRKDRDGFYTITIENRTGTELEDLEIRYVIRVERTSVASTKDRKIKEWESGSIKKFSIGNREEKTEETIRIHLQETDLMPGWYWANAAPPKSEDKLDGIYVAILYDGSLVREYAMPSGFLEDGREEMFPGKK